VQPKELSIRLTSALAMLAIATLMTATQAHAQTETVLHSFGAEKKDGQRPFTGLTADASGNLYGTTFYGGAHGYGTAFKLTPAAGGAWTETVMHTFNHDGRDGIYPEGNLILDSAGNVYGTASAGGTHGYGSVFELSARAGGGWTEKTLHNFNVLPDGQNPSAGVVFDAAGNIYGTTAYGGVHGVNGGTVFELTPNATGGWTEKSLYSFLYGGTDGYYVGSGVILDTLGNIYGTTTNGGLYGDGIVFELTPKAGGSSTETILHNFNGTDGWSPSAGLILDASGNLYGSTEVGGANHAGVVFELSRAAGGGWSETLLHTFSDGTDGFGPDSNLIFDSSGNLYGTTGGGGAYGLGIAFELTPSASGAWTESILHTFGIFGDGSGPVGLVFNANGNLYGTTEIGGVHGLGTVFEVTP
jgi:uncharacterized repeat protein (TIGR03803 family)